MTNPIEAIINDDANAFRDQVNDMLLSKLGDRLENQRVVVASTMFGDEVEAEEEEIADEE